MWCEDSCRRSAKARGNSHLELIDIIEPKDSIYMLFKAASKKSLSLKFQVGS